MALESDPLAVLLKLNSTLGLVLPLGDFKLSDKFPSPSRR